MKVTAILLASGSSRRMLTKQNKLLLPYRSKPMIKHIIDIVLQADFFERIIVTNHQEIIALSDGYKIVGNSNAANGQSSSIKAGVSAASGDAFAFFVCDQPNLSLVHIQSLQKLYFENGEKIIVTENNGNLVNPAIFPKKYLSELMSLQGDVGARAIIHANLSDIVCCKIRCPKEVQDIDSYEDYLNL